jgi:pyruvate dehydrogenase E2 component (dihydrolipoamide acetyltransferase)
LLEDLLKFKRIDGVQGVLMKVMNAFVDKDTQISQWRDVLNNEVLKTLVIWGDKDKILPSDHALELPSQVQVEILADYGHMVQMEAASEVNRIILEFWNN